MPTSRSAQLCALSFVLLTSFPNLLLADNPAYPSCDSVTWTLVATDSMTFDWSNLVQGDDGEVEVFFVRYHDGSDTLAVIDVDRISATGTCAGIDTVNLPYLFDEFSRFVVLDMIAGGTIGSSANCSSPSRIEILVPDCITRSGSGSTIAFSAVDECEQAERVVEHCTSGGIASAGVVERSGQGTCTGSEESTGTGVGIE